MPDTSFCRLALSGYQLPPLCRSDDLTRGLAEAKPIRLTHPSPLHLAPDFYEHTVPVPHVRNDPFPPTKPA